MRLVKLFQNSYKFLLTLCVPGRIIYMTDARRCYYGTAMLRKSIIPKIMRFGII